MNKFDSHPPLRYPTNAESVISAFPSVAVNTTPKTARRLLVLVPIHIDCSSTTRRIWELANAGGMYVQLLGLCEDPAEEPALRRRLVGMASLLQDGGVCAEIKVDVGINWMKVVTANYKAGDVIVCFAEQHTGLLRRSLSQVLESNFRTTVYILSSSVPQQPKRNALSQIRAWLVFISIILGFGVLQANIMQLPEGWSQNLLLILSIIPEFWLIWTWHFQTG